MGEKEGWGRGPRYLDAAGTDLLWGIFVPRYKPYLVYDMPWPGAPPPPPHESDPYVAVYDYGWNRPWCCWRAIWPWHRCKEEVKHGPVS